jgi:hypothetical protein
MATGLPQYIPGQDPESLKANQAYQEALNRMLQSLDARKNRLFDPVLLSFAAGMLDPGKTGSFGEALGRAAGNVREAEAARVKEDQELAQMRLQMAGQAMEMERQKSRERGFMRAMGEPGGQGAPVAPAAQQPSPGASQAPAGAPTPAAPTGASPPGFSGVPGVTVAPPDSKFLGRRQYLAAAMTDPKKSLADAMREAEDLEHKRWQTREGGVFDVATGMFYQFPKGEAVERQIGGKTYKIPAQSAALLDLYQTTNDPRYTELASRLTTGGVGGPLKSEGERAIERTEEEARAGALGKAAAEKESTAGDRANTARSMLFNASRVDQLVRQSPQAFGIFARPTLLASLGTIISKGVQTPGGTVNMAGFEDAVRQAMPGVGQKDLDNVTLAAGALAEIELAYTQLYMTRQGAITEGEREVVRRLGGGVSQSPGALLEKSKLIRLRSQHDLNVNDAWQEFKESNPRASYLTFERSPRYRELTNKYNDTLYGAFGLRRGGAESGPAPTFKIRPVQE